MRTMTLLLGILLMAGSISAAEELRIDPSKVEQLKRLEPLSPEKVQVFVDAGQLNEAQKRLVVMHIDKNGTLALPADFVGAEAPPAPAPAAAREVARYQVPRQGAPTAGSHPPVQRRSDGSLDVVGWIQADDRMNPLPGLPAGEAQRLKALLNEFRGLEGPRRDQIKNEIRARIPAVNPLIGEVLDDPVDLYDAASMWKAVAFHGNTRAAGYIAHYHQLIMNRANPVLIPYAKDVGGLLFRREKGNEEPRRRWYDSRDVRELVLDLEKSISQCGGVRAATYLMDVLAARYYDEAPMRDSGRDKGRIVEACGGNKESFNRGKPETWNCRLPGYERALIAERLIPHLRADDGDLRDVARDGLLVVLGAGTSDKKLKDRLEDARKEWNEFLSWYVARRDQLLATR